MISRQAHSWDPPQEQPLYSSNNLPPTSKQAGLALSSPERDPASFYLSPPSSSTFPPPPAAASTSHTAAVLPSLPSANPPVSLFTHQLPDHASSAGSQPFSTALSAATGSSQADYAAITEPPTALELIMSVPHRGLPPPATLDRLGLDRVLPQPHQVQQTERPTQSNGLVLGNLPAAPAQWTGQDESMRSWLHAKSEEDRRKQEEEKTRQEGLRLEQRKIEQTILQESLRGGIPPPMVPMVFASMGGANVSNMTLEWAQHYMNQMNLQQQQQALQLVQQQQQQAQAVVLAQQQQQQVASLAQQQPSTNGDVSREQRLLTGPPTTGFPPQQPSYANPTNPVDRTRTLVAGTTAFSARPPHQTQNGSAGSLSRINATEAQPLSSAVNLQSLHISSAAQQQGGHQPQHPTQHHMGQGQQQLQQEYSSSSPTIFFHHYVPPGSQSNTNNAASSQSNGNGNSNSNTTSSPTSASAAASREREREKDRDREGALRTSKSASTSPRTQARSDYPSSPKKRKVHPDTVNFSSPDSHSNNAPARRAPPSVTRSRQHSSASSPREDYTTGMGVGHNNQNGNQPAPARYYTNGNPANSMTNGSSGMASPRNDGLGSIRAGSPSISTTAVR